MAVLRKLNILSQQRFDTPDAKAIESAASNDFDQLIQSFVLGTEEGYILRGFEIAMSGAINGAATGLQLIVDSGSIFHPKSSQSGTFLVVPAGTPPEALNSATNTLVDGAFSPSAVNYVGIEYERFLDDATASQVYLWDPSSKSEITKVAPRALVLRYRIKISTSSWASNVLPLCIVVTDGGNNVVSIEDRRRMLFRLGTAGRSTPNPLYTYPWTNHSEGRSENPSLSYSDSINPFHGGDKMIDTLKGWMDAMMSSLQEIKGTTYWYSPNTSGSLEILREDLGNTLVVGRGSISHSSSIAGQINWDQDIYLRIVGSRLAYKIEANPSATYITLGDNEVAYLSLVRGVEVSPNLIFGGANPSIVSSVGSVPWTSQLLPGDWIKLGADTDAGYYEIASKQSLAQVTLTEPFAGTPTGIGGAKAKYSFGTYYASATPGSDPRAIQVADREDVPMNQDSFWLLARSDNSGTIPRVYVRFLGSELEQGEDRQISDNTTLELLQYIGSPIESASEPQFVSALNPGSVPEIIDVQVGDASTILSNQYLLIDSAGDWRRYCVWFNKDGTGTEPNIPYRNVYIEIPITTGMTASQIAAILASELDSTSDNDFDAVQQVSPNDDTVRITNTSSGSSVDASKSLGALFTIAKIQEGTGTGNRSVVDGDNLTLAIKKLDEALGELATALDTPAYDEVVEIVSSGGVPPSTVDGPVLAGAYLTLPYNSRLGSIPQEYTVGKGILQLCLNGQRLVRGKDWNEVGLDGTISDQIEILQDLLVSDFLKFEIIAVGAGGGGGSAVPGPAGPPGPQGLPGADAAGGPIAISTKTSDYNVLGSDNVLLADCSSGSVTFYLPPAASVIGQMFYFKKIDGTANAMIIEGNGAETIDGALNKSSTVQYESFTIVNDGTNFWIL